MFYHVTDFDGLFRATQATFGSGFVETFVFDHANLLLDSIQTGTSGSVENRAYDWYPPGALKQRIDYRAGKTEDFEYDALNRLRKHKLNGTPILDVQYTNDSNIYSKSDVGTYAKYGGSSGGPHAVTSITGLQTNSYAYDANGNMTNRDGDAITWYSFNLPKKINYGTSWSEFWYGTDRAPTSRWP